MISCIIVFLLGVITGIIYTIANRCVHKRWIMVRNNKRKIICAKCRRKATVYKPTYTKKRR
jgi:hypothetical protein